MTKKTFSGGVPATQLSGALSSSATSFTVSSATGYPSGSGGPFVVCIDRGTASEEKILISSVASTTFTVASGGRGYDGTTATTHSSSATVEHVLDAATIAEANDHVNTTTRDDHTQYLNNARHDVTSRHAFGAALGTPGSPAAVGTTASAGTGSAPARSDHVHVLGTDSVTTTAIAANAVTTAKFATGAVDAAALATDSVTTAKIAANAITSAKIATDSVTSAAIAADAVGSSEIAAGAVGSSELAANAVIAGKLADGSVEATARLVDGIITRSKLATGFTGITVGSAPSSPVEGETYYNTTSDALLSYTTATTGWVAPWNLPWGVLGYATDTALRAGFPTTAAEINSGLRITFTVPANRRLRMTAGAQIKSASGNAGYVLTVYTSAGTYIAQLARFDGNIGTGVKANGIHLITPSAGTYTYTLYVASTTGTVDVDASGLIPTWFCIEDLGPTGAPA